MIDQVQRYSATAGASNPPYKLGKLILIFDTKQNDILFGYMDCLAELSNYTQYLSNKKDARKRTPF